jgi:hypothetical protein
MRSTLRLLALFAVSSAAVGAAVACGGKLVELPITELDAGPVADTGVRKDAGRVDSGTVDSGVIVPRETTPILTVELGPKPVGERFEFKIPSNVIGVNIIGRGAGIESFADLISPNKQNVITGSIPFNGDHETTISFTGAIAVGGAPLSNHPDAMPLLAGLWAGRFQGEPGNVNVTIHMQSTPDGKFHGGALDVNLFVPDGLEIEGETVSAAIAANSPAIRDRMQAFDRQLKSLYGIDLGNIAYYKLPASARDLSDEARLMTSIRATRAATTARALNIVLAEASEGQDWWGIALGIPGAANLLGSDASGIALATVPEADADMEGAVLAHEAGHFFGLSHLSEFEAGGNDPLEDTAQCPGITLQNFQRCPDAENVMAAAGAAYFKAIPIIAPMHEI